MLIRFKNDNLWQIDQVDDSLICYHRIPKLHQNVDYSIDEEDMVSGNGNFNYVDWKAFFGDNKLKLIATDFRTEQYALPLIYYCIYIKGYTKMERIRSSKYKFTHESPA